METKTAVWLDSKFYKVGERYIASVTTKLGIESKPFLYRYYGELGFEQARKKLKEAGDRGSRIHYAFFVYNEGGCVIYNPSTKANYSKEEIDALVVKYSGLIAILTEQDEMNDLWKLQKLMGVLKPKILQSEHTVFSTQKDIAGTLDLAIEAAFGEYDVSGSKPLVLDNGIYICDLKTGNVISESTWAQMAAYTEAYEEMYGVKVKGALCLHTSAQTRKGIEGLAVIKKTREELKPHFEIYQHLSAVWNARNPNIAPKAFEFPTLITRRQ